MVPRAARTAPRGGDESGFTLLEVIVAIVLLTAVSLTAAGFMTRSVATSSGLDGRQAAVTVARQVMEQARAVDATFSLNAGTYTSALSGGRNRADSVAAWTTAGVGTTDTYTGSGPTTFDSHTYGVVSGPSVTPTVPFTQSKTVDNRTYQVRTLIGTCVRPRASGTCAKGATGDELFRVVVVVTWTDRTCLTAGACRYQLATLIDPAQQPTFNTLRRPVAYDDPDDGLPALTVAAGDSADVAVVTNDSGYFALQGAVDISTAPTYGTAVPQSGSNLVTYTAPTAYSGPVNFLYTATDTNGARSNAANVVLTVLPKAVADAYTTATRTSTLPVLSNDLGSMSGATITIISNPSGGATATVSGANVLFTAPAQPGSTRSYSFSYTVRDASGGVSAPVTSTIAATTPAKPTAAAVSATTPSGAAVNIDVTSKITPTAGLTVTTSATNAVPSGNVIRFTPNGSSSPQTFQYTVTDSWGQSATATVTVTVTVAAQAPTAPNLSLSTTNGGTYDLEPYVTYTGTLVITTTSSRAYMTDNTHMTFDGTKKRDGGDYDVTYTVTDSTGLSATGTIYVRKP